MDNQQCVKIGEYFTDQNANYNGVIYMDYQASTPIDPRVLDIMFDAFKNDFGNPHSVSHVYGWRAKDLIKIARKNVANVIGADSKDIIFTSGATESNNMAIKGICEFYGNSERNHIITVKTEHKCVLQACKVMEGKGFNVTYLDVQKDGLINMQHLEDCISDKTILVSVMAVNNEIGVIQNIKEIGRIAKKHGAFFHTDAAQAFGKILLDVDDMNIDLMSISGHKIYGPKGVGALYIRRKPKVKILPLIHGGGQERGLRSGTLPAPLIAGFGEAARILTEDFEIESKRIEHLGTKLKEGLLSIENVNLNGSWEHRFKGNINCSFDFVEGESLLMSIPMVAVSSGSACTSETLEPSYVLRAISTNEVLVHSSIRFGIGRFTTESEIENVISSVKTGFYRLREMSPLYEMQKEGVDLNTVKWHEV